MAKDTRKRGITLDPVKLQKLAKEKGYDWLSFDAEMDQSPIIFKGTAKKLWNGKRLDIGQAKRAINLLGRSSYDSLLPETCPDIVFPEKLEWNASQNPPGSLLQAEYGIVPFHLRQQELEDLDSWCCSDHPLAIRLYTGAGGMGKTRLAIEQCTRLQDKDWLTGFLKRISSNTKTESRFNCFKTISQDVFIVIDYAETRREELVELIKASLQANCKLRLILLARAAADWWNLLKTERDGVGNLLASPSSSWVTLQPLSLQRKQREDSYFLAIESFGKILKQAPPLFAPDDLDAEYFERVLLLHMQALINVEEKQPETGIQAILNVIIQRERRFWEEQAKNKELPVGLHSAIGEVMARITMIGGVKTKQDAVEVLNAVALISKAQPHERTTILKLLHDLYPCNQAFQGVDTPDCNYIEPLQPDLLGEHLIQEELEKNAESILDDIFG